MIHHGDCIEVMAAMPEASVDAIVTDPPYGLEFMGKAWDRLWREGPDGQRGRIDGKGGMETFGKRPTYTAGRSFMEWCEAWGREALRVTKPGGYLLAFGGTRTHHRLVCGLEDAGWIIRDELDWIYASGFPKGKANLKPAHEPIVLARKPGPLQPLAIDACRIPGQWTTWRRADGTINPDQGFRDAFVGGESKGQFSAEEHPAGRWPSNVLLSDPELFDEPNPEIVGSGAIAASGLLKAGTPRDVSVETRKVAYGTFAGNQTDTDTYGDSGGYSRFFIVPKADRSDREPIIRPLVAGRASGVGADKSPDDSGESLGARANHHPTVKPTDLMRHLVRLVTPTGGVVLDPFLGSGSTAIAAEMEGFDWIGIEKEAEYIAIAEARLNGTQRGLGLDVPLSQPPRKLDPRVIASKGPSRPEGASVSTWFTTGHKPEEAA